MKNWLVIVGVTVLALAGCDGKTTHTGTITRSIGKQQKEVQALGGGAIALDKVTDQGCLSLPLLIKELQSNNPENPMIVSTQAFDLGTGGGSRQKFAALGDETSNAIRKSLLTEKESEFRPVYRVMLRGDLAAASTFALPVGLSPDKFNPFDIKEQNGCSTTNTPNRRVIANPAPTPTTPVTPVAAGTITLTDSTKAIEITASSDNMIAFTDNAGHVREYRLTKSGVLVTVYSNSFNKNVCGKSVDYTSKQGYFFSLGDGLQSLPVDKAMLKLLVDAGVPLMTVKVDKVDRALPVSYDQAVKFIEAGKVKAATCPAN